MNGHTWKDKLAFVGLVWEVLPYKVEVGMFSDDDGLVCVKVLVPQGLLTFGYGGTLEDALRNGAIGHSIDWFSVERKMTDSAWAKIAHC